MESKAQRIALALQGFGAGVNGRSAQFMNSLAARRQFESNRMQALDESRQKALLKDAFTAQQMIKSGDTAGALQFTNNRIDHINRLGGDPTHSIKIRDKMLNGDFKGALNDLNIAVNYAVGTGAFELPKPVKAQQPKTQVINGQVVTINPDGTSSAAPIPGFVGKQPDPGDAKDRALRERQIAVSEAAEKRQENRLSAGLEKVLLASQDNIVNSQNSAERYGNLATQFESQAGDIQSGLGMTFTEGMKALLGTEDAVTELRRNLNQARISIAQKNLPPGVASDNDVKLAFKGVPRESASPEQIVSFLRGMAKIESAKASYEQMKSDYISKNRTGAGINQAWRKSLSAPTLKRKVTVSEIYSTAQNRGMTPEDVMKQLGIDGEIF